MKSLDEVRQLYLDRLEARKTRAAALELKSARIAGLRLFVFLCGLATLGAALFGGWFPAGVALLPLAVFVVLVILHDRNLKALQEAALAVSHFEAARRRLEDRWAGQGITRVVGVPEGHPYALDLDVFGSGSLFDLLCTARTSSGEEFLARWLLEPSTVEEIRERQAAIAELKERMDLREAIDLRARAMRSLGDSARLSHWAASADPIDARLSVRLRLLFGVLSVAAVAAVVSCFFYKYGLAILTGVAIVEWVVGRLVRERIDALTIGVEGPRSEMKVIAELLALIEEEKTTSPLLEKILGELRRPTRASSAISSLARVADWLDQYRNQLFTPIGFLLMWRGQFALSIASWKRVHGAQVPQWLSALGQFEALLSLSGFAFEHPEAIFAEVVSDGPVLQAAGMRHPLLPRGQCVPNDIHLDRRCQIWVVSGSNMSGKSTFLRVIGINAVLAMAGAPVLATTFKMSPLAVGATIRVLDSLQGGKSRFYAEISALKDIVSIARKDVPLLFLLDEIFHGTNSHDRRIGAEAIIKQLLSLGAIGLLTTHDLVLARAAEALGDSARNVHFEDSVEDGELHFDYLLKDGVVEKSNALLLMRKVGLDV